MRAGVWRVRLGLRDGAVRPDIYDRIPPAVLTPERALDIQLSSLP